MIILPSELKLPVIPVLKPTVPMADVVSKIKSRKSKFSVNESKKVDKNITAAYNIKTDVATYNLSAGILFPKKVT